MARIINPEASGDLEEYAQGILKEHSHVLTDARIAKIAYMVSFPKNENNKKISFTTKIKKANNEMNHLTGYDYVIFADGVWWDLATKSEKEREVLHVLFHIKSNINKSGDNTWAFKKHDIESFAYVDQAYPSSTEE